MNKELLSDSTAGEKSKKKVKNEVKQECIIYEDLEGKLLLIRVGSEQGKASEKQLDYMQKKLTKEIEKKGVNCIVVVADYDVSMQIIEKQK